MVVKRKSRVLHPRSKRRQENPRRRRKRKRVIAKEMKPKRKTQ